jgi:hypothetical protein
MNKLKYLFLSILYVGLIAIAAAVTVPAQADDGVVPVSNSQLTAINLPPGAQRVRDEKVPEEIRDTLAKLIAEGGEGVRQGASEVILWGGNYKKGGAGARMIKNLETALKNSGWQYKSGENSDDLVMFTVFRPAPASRALVGFFGQSKDIFVFALTEMLLVGSATQAETENRAGETNTPKTTKTERGDELSIYGKWGRSKGGGFVDYTGKTNYKSGEHFYFEFFPDGTVQYTKETDVLSIMQCKIKGADSARGKFTVSGNSLTINLGAGKSFETNSCNSRENFNKTLEPATITVKFQIKKSDSVLRPDKPTMMCFNGEDVCYEKIVR